MKEYRKCNQATTKPSLKTKARILRHGSAQDRSETSSMRSSSGEPNHHSTNTIQVHPRKQPSQVRKDTLGHKERVKRPRRALTLVSAKAIVDLTEVARVRLSPLLGGLGAAAVTTSAAGHLLVRLSHARAAKARLALVKWLTARAGPCDEELVKLRLGTK